MKLSKIFLFFNLLSFIHLLEKYLSSEIKRLGHSSIKESKNTPHLQTSLSSNTFEETELLDDYNSEQQKKSECDNAYFDDNLCCSYVLIEPLNEKNCNPRKNNKKLRKGKFTFNEDLSLDCFCYSSCESLNELIENTYESRKYYRKKSEVDDDLFLDSLPIYDNDYSLNDPGEFSQEKVDNLAKNTQIENEQLQDSDDSNHSNAVQCDILESIYKKKYTSSDIFKLIKREAEILEVKLSLKDYTFSSSSEDDESSSEGDISKFTKVRFNIFDKFNVNYTYDMFLKSHNLSNSMRNDNMLSAEPFELDNSYHRVTTYIYFKKYVLKLLYDGYKELEEIDKIRALLKIKDLNDFTSKISCMNLVFLTNEEKEDLLIDAALLLYKAYKSENQF
ncbi:sporozoite invasion-associated protein 2, putative [Plasmodium relictum]|uniref:Sporozoite invasion-associated protein 2, putative n=1 Tax=Plasmodium relictum TaxID=85471 RepID=A0A1J1GKE8_PLARL|nr:sporozoite invasion-associated protein 2, putative [Plasmodium relictum]CRG84968.1 sporozoite invasion-associated protein 2, putative [Plasmodium relictum]